MPAKTRDGVTFELPERWKFEARRRGKTDETVPGTVTADQVALAIGEHFELVTVQPMAPDSAAPRPSRRRGEPATPPEPGVVRVTVAADENAVLLVEQDGAYFWVDGTATDGQKRRGAVATRTVTFELDLRDTATPRRGRTRGFTPKILLKPLKVIVFKFLAKVAVGKVVEHFEKDLTTGLVWITSSKDSDRWAPLEPGQAGPKLPKDRQARVLLLVHGTFSSTEGGYGHLKASQPGRQFLDRSLASYDAVIGFDHRTLTEDPKTNAEHIQAALEGLDQGQGIVIDAVTHSRGALVLRSLAEHLLGTTGPIRVNRAVMVAGPNAGTSLAAPANWKDLIDLYTNLVVGSSRIVTFALPQTALATRIITEATKGIAALVKAITTVAVDASVAPGLAAMDPGGAFIKQINAQQPDQPNPDQIWYAAITTDYEPDLLGGPGQLPKRVGFLIADIGVDKLMGSANDLVVNVPSMTSVDLPAQYFKDVYNAPQSATLFHTTYFNDPQVIHHLGAWLSVATVPNAPTTGPSGGTVIAMPDGGTGEIVVLDSGFSREAARDRIVAADPDFAVIRRSTPKGVEHFAFPRVDFDKRLARVRSDHTVGKMIAVNRRPSFELPLSGHRGVKPLDLDGAVILRDDEPVGVIWPGPTRGVRGLRPGPSDDANADPAKPAPIKPARRRRAPPLEARIGALMPDRVAVGARTTTVVEMTVDDFQVAVGAGARTRTFKPTSAAPITVDVIAKSNVTVVGASRRKVDFPRPGEPQLVSFVVQGEREGPGQVVVAATQEGADLVRLVLHFSVVEASDATPVGVLATTVSASRLVETGLVPPPCDKMWIDETRSASTIQVEGAVQVVTLETAFDVRYLSEGKDVGERGVTQPIRGDLLAFVTGVYAQIEDDWSQSRSPAAFQARLKSIGGQLFDELVPDSIQKVLWDNRERITTVQVTSDDPFIPWELVHLKDPRGRLPKEDLYLANLGIVRWLDGVGQPPRGLTFRPTKRFVIAPEYPAGSGWELDTATEIENLEGQLGVRRTEPTWEALLKLIGSPGKFDLLHYAGHGGAPAGDINQAGLVFEVTKDVDTDTWVPSSISATMVEQYANLRPASGKGARPLVFLNACQVGRAGYQLTSIGGFAKAFIAAGAGAFISSLWEVGDEPAIAFCERFYERLCQGDTIAQATTAARASARDGGDPTWLAYVVYGQPDAKVKLT